jgi:HK97 family phage portal protein
MGLTDFLLGGPPLLRFRSALLQQPQAPPPAQKLHYLPGTQVAFTETSPYGGMLTHGPGATDILNAPRGGDANSIVFACLRVLSDAYIEPPLRVYTVDAEGERDPVRDHPLQVLLDRPNPGMTGRELRRWLRWVCALEGNAYLRKLRAGDRRTGNVTALWPISPTRMEILSRGTEYISAYRYHYAPGKWEDLPPENVLHFRSGLDDADHRRGLSLIRRVLGLLTTDWQAILWANSLLANGAVPGSVLETDAALTQQQADELKARLQAVYGVGGQGGVAVLGNGAKWHQVGLKPEDMATTALHRLSEERISGCFGVPAILAGLGVGLDQATYSNARVLGELFTERTLMPLWALDEDKWHRGLDADFGLSDRLICAHDLSDVRALQEDEDAKYKRLDTAVKGGWVTINEARTDAGWAPLPDGDVLMLPAQWAPTPPERLRDASAVPSPSVEASGDDIPAAFRNMGGPLPESKQDEATVTDADLAAWRARGRALGIEDFTGAVSNNGNGQH